MSEQDVMMSDPRTDAYADLEREHVELEDRFSRLITLLEQQGIEFTDEMRQAIEGELEDDDESDDPEVEGFFAAIQENMSLAQRFNLAQRIIAETSAYFLECLPAEGDTDTESYDSSYVDTAISIGANLARLDLAAQALADVQLLEIVDGDDEEDDDDGDSEDEA